MTSTELNEIYPDGTVVARWKIADTYTDHHVVIGRKGDDTLVIAPLVEVANKDGWHSIDRAAARDINVSSLNGYVLK